MMTCFRSVRRALGIGALVAVGAGGLGCGGEPGAHPAGFTAPAGHPQVIGGTATPGELGFAVNRFERNAAVGQAVKVAGTTYQGCSGTLVGDRVVVTAGHCVVQNQEQWIYQGAEPQVAPPNMVSYAVGDDVDQPLWLARAESVHLHPDAEPQISQQRILHDVALVILSESAWENCDQVVPVQLNRDPLDDTLLGEQLLQGGFGSLDGSYDFSPKRYWSLVQVSAVDDAHVTVDDIGQGFPTYGDSGSGLLRRFPDGSLRNLGVASSGVSGSMRFTRLDTQGTLLDTLLTPELVCGPVDANGTCRDDVSVHCDAHGMSSDDCRARSETCVVADGQASCQCSCDGDATCDATCACDADCPCACDVSADCDQGCACDAACATPPKPQSTADEGSGCSTRTRGSAPPGWLAAALLLAAFAARRTVRCQPLA